MRVVFCGRGWGLEKERVVMGFGGDGSGGVLFFWGGDGRLGELIY